MAVLSIPLAVSGAVCDLDGVLTDTAGLHELAWATTMNAFLREHCRPREGDRRPFSHDDYRTHVDGLPREDGARAFLRARGLEAEQATVALLAARKDRHFEELLQEAAPGPLPGAVELLRALRARGVTLAVATSSRHGRDVLRAAGLSDLVDVVVDGADAARLSLPGKPDSTVFLHACRMLELAADRCVLFEDSRAGVLAARSAGFRLVVGVTPDPGPLEEAGASLVVPTLAGLEIERSPADVTWAAVVLDADGLAPLLRARRSRVTGALTRLARSGVRVCTGPLEAALERLLDDGLGPGLVLAILTPDAAVTWWRRPRPAGGERLLVVAPVNGDEVLALLTERHRRRHRVPGIDEDPAWVIREVGTDPMRHRVTEALFTLAEAGIGLRGAVEEAPRGSMPMVLGAGVYHGVGSKEHLLPGPIWTGLRLTPPPGEDVRILDLRTGVLLRSVPGPDAEVLRTARFLSAAQPGRAAMRAEGTIDVLAAGPPLLLPEDGAGRSNRRGRVRWATVAGRRGGITVACAQRQARDSAGRRTVERLVAQSASGDVAPRPDELADQVEAFREETFDVALAAHRRAWATRWRACAIDLPDEPDIELGLRFALFHLWGAAGACGESAVGARDLSGPGYAGHVFWDADAFVLPALVTMCPPAARTMLEYRLRRLPSAQARAAREGYAGARFPWESASSGDDVTPHHGHLGGRRVAVLTGAEEEHITADVAWAADCYARWSGDDAFLAGAGRPLVIETARYWASRCRTSSDGTAHIEGVIGPDEYHEHVDDNAFTNVMARWNMVRAADLCESEDRPTEETRRWRDLAGRLVDGWDPRHGRHEQFRGYSSLEPLLAADLGPVPLAADVLLPPERLARTQLVKQPDVLMLHHLLPHAARPGSLAADLEHYLPRTVHGSSLSPAVSASVLARSGRPDEALTLLRTAVRMDLDDTTGISAGGLHVAAMGGAWQAILTGFLGIDVRDGVLNIAPQLPASWRRVGVRFRCLGRHVDVYVTGAEMTVRVDGPLAVRVGAEPVVLTDADHFLTQRWDRGAT
ncbi:HAD-IA family hydrolase [Terrabacter sp. MAHUQ-38]|uniref:HAD-IA family hydrolase n=1 Tax=unclassified Terrabacter TaxID=2630222 RepID=UPI00165E63A8|nr:HAD-IA family hydrolase [Terrabacter sp. MAHUQ-38]